MKYLIIIVLLVAFSHSNAQITVIPDANFEQALINLGYDIGLPNGIIPTANINAITNLGVSNQSISDLTGIEDFTALTYLNCNDNQLANLDLSQNTGIMHLYCSNNQISNLNITQNPAIITLHCYGNQLSNLDLTQNIALSFLYCGSNQLSNIDVTQNSALTTMYCDNNQLGVLNVMQNTGLYVLDCSNNQLNDLDVTFNPMLSNLRCHINQLGNLNVTQNPGLIFLVASTNQLSSLDVSQNTSLTYLNCANNILTSLDVSQNIALNYLFCNSNLLTSLDVSQNIDLMNLWCSDNQLNCLNVKNGYNIWITSFIATNNSSLSCIEVDNVEWSTTNWINIDQQASYSLDCNNGCSAVGLAENSFGDLSIYPNPTAGKISIDLIETFNNINLSLINNLGQVVFSQSYRSASSINLAIPQPKGIYFLQLESDGEIFTQKIIKE